MRPSSRRPTSIVLLLIAVLLVVALAYDRGKKCGAWESVNAGAKSKQAQLSKPFGCWRLH
jgi:hypothetical protein